MGKLAPVIVYRGRKRKAGPRHACGKLVQPKPEEPNVVALRMPHRKGVPAKLAHDPLAESVLGRYSLNGRITVAEREAGIWYRGVVARYRRDLDAPKPDPRSISGAIVGRSEEEPAPQGQPRIDERSEDERARHNKDTYDNAFTAMHEAGHHAQKWVARVAVYDQECPSEFFKRFRIGLIALAVHRNLLTNRDAMALRQRAALDFREQIVDNSFRN